MELVILCLILALIALGIYTYLGFKEQDKANNAIADALEHEHELIELIAMEDFTHKKGKLRKGIQVLEFSHEKGEDIDEFTKRMAKTVSEELKKEIKSKGKEE